MNKTKDIATIYNLYVNDLFTYGCYLGFQGEVVKDAIHDVFVKVATDSTTLEEISNIKFYLFRSLKNRLLDIHKGNKEHVGLENISSEISGMPFHITVSLEDTLIEAEEKKRVKTEIEKMLHSLTDRQREIIYLRYVQEYDYEQIAELLQISIHGCRKLVSKAMQVLREKYASLILLLLMYG